MGQKTWWCVKKLSDANNVSRSINESKQGNVQICVLYHKR